MRSLITSFFKKKNIENSFFSSQRITVLSLQLEKKLFTINFFKWCYKTSHLKYALWPLPWVCFADIAFADTGCTQPQSLSSLHLSQCLSLLTCMTNWRIIDVTGFSISKISKKNQDIDNRATTHFSSPWISPKPRLHSLLSVLCCQSDLCYSTALPGFPYDSSKHLFRPMWNSTAFLFSTPSLFYSIHPYKLYL